MADVAKRRIDVGLFAYVSTRYADGIISCW
jgi:hypothetical protein